ncbi:MAG: hypothetical protein ACRD5M_14740 [Candidatus Acidiferrales bacterium]
MQKFLGLLAVLIIFAIPALAQDSTSQEAQKEPEAKKEAPKQGEEQKEAPEKEKPVQITPKYEVEGGYTYRSFYPPSAKRFGMNGWNVTLDYNRKNWFSVVLDGTDTSKSQGLNGKTSIYTAMAGPRVYLLGHRHRLIPFGQILFGAGYERVVIPAQGGFPVGHFHSLAYVWAGGGGIDVRVTRHWAVRAFEFDYEKTHFSDFFNQVLSPSESNRRISVGIVYRWGER